MMWFEKFKLLARQHIAAALTSTTLIGALLGAVFTDLGNFRSTNRDIVKRQLEISEQADRELGTVLQKFSDRATGRANLVDDDVRALRASVSKSFTAAENLTSRFPSAKAEFESYADALVTLQKAAEKFKGPQDAKPFVEAVSKYYVSKQSFDRRVTSLQTSWLL